ncbi:membrane-spanning 4-domains subfamily A member 6C-like [Anneissia japonica]|uniref:membrane-spanning 4-domains subfamily A member 6C-like n=1 Tax=Anneissia japonica TaxID=1529436 RepID=UPI001425842D|nr:membrane-spanning 4-domains subfamily A member 6C-like [Anneissia japonica]
MPPFERLTQRIIQPQRPYYKNGQIVVGVLLIIAASLTLVFGIVSVSLPTVYYGFYGTPLWTGAMIMIGGILSVLSSKYDNKCATAGGLVMNILSIICACIIIILMSITTLLEEYGSNDHCAYESGYIYYYSGCKTEKAMDIILLVLGVIELGLTIAAVCVLSMDVCCCSTSQQGMGATLLRDPAELAEIQTRYSQVVVPAGAYPVSQVQYPAGQPQQYPAAQPQNYPACNPSLGAP